MGGDGRGGEGRGGEGRGGEGRGGVHMYVIASSRPLIYLIEIFISMMLQYINHMIIDVPHLIYKGALLHAGGGL